MYQKTLRVEVPTVKIDFKNVRNAVNGCKTGIAECISLNALKTLKLKELHVLQLNKKSYRKFFRENFLTSLCFLAVKFFF